MKDYVELGSGVTLSHDQLGMHHLSRRTLLIPQLLAALVVRILPRSIPQITKEFHLLREAQQRADLALSPLSIGQRKDGADSIKGRI